MKVGMNVPINNNEDGIKGYIVLENIDYMSQYEETGRAIRDFQAALMEISRIQSSQSE